MTLQEFNKLDKSTAAKELFSCCGSEQWVSLMMSTFPFASEKLLVERATGSWYDVCGKADWLQSFTHHPKIGDSSSLKEKFAGKEQAGVAAASNETIEALMKGNEDYEKKFGFIFIVCATGRSADEMLQLQNGRLTNSYDEELNIAMGEQHKITIIRFKKLFAEADWNWMKVSQLTTHVLDTSIGRPGRDISIRLQQPGSNGWRTISQGITNADGRIGDLLPPERILPASDYKMVFDTGKYFAANNIKGFYPQVEIQFSVFDDAHYHVPLLVNPFGYSTYRGS